MSVCENIQLLLHRRGELTGNALTALTQHLRRCHACHNVLIEIERTEELLSSWKAPPAPENLADKVVAILNGEDQGLRCQDVEQEIHHYISQDLEPWKVSGVEAHLDRCRNCQELLEESRQARRTWQTWQAPEPPAKLTRSILHHLQQGQPEPAPAREPAAAAPPSGRDFASPSPLLRLQRVAAAAVLLLTGITGGVLWDDLASSFVAGDGSPEEVANDRRPPTFREITLYGSDSGFADLTDSFSESYRSTRGHVLRSAKNG